MVSRLADIFFLRGHRSEDSVINQFLPSVYRVLANMGSLHPKAQCASLFAMVCFADLFLLRRAKRRHVLDRHCRGCSGEACERGGRRTCLKRQGFRATSDASGHFAFQGLGDNTYRLSVIANGKPIASSTPIVPSLHRSPATLSLLANGLLTVVHDASESAKSGGEKLSSHAVSEIPLNKRDFSQLLLLAAGTATDTNGASNYTQQFAINGQRGVEATFAVDGADASDPELGGATFTNFNVDAVQEIQSSSGWMPAEIGRGGAGYTNIVTRTGTDALHGSVFEFIRNSALDARNYFDHASPANPGADSAIPTQ